MPSHHARAQFEVSFRLELARGWEALFFRRVEKSGLLNHGRSNAVMHA